MQRTHFLVDEEGKLKIQTLFRLEAALVGLANLAKSNPGEDSKERNVQSRSHRITRKSCLLFRNHVDHD